MTGSAYVELGATKVIGLVQGPKAKDSNRGEEFLMEVGVADLQKYIVSLLLIL